MRIADLVPYEACYTGPKLKKAISHLKKDKKFGPPADVFEVDGEWFVRDGTHHVLAALQMGETEVPVSQVFPPGDVNEIKRQWDRHMALKGFVNLPKCSGLGQRGDVATDALKIDKDKLLESIKKVKE